MMHASLSWCRISHIVDKLHTGMQAFKANESYSKEASRAKDGYSKEAYRAKGGYRKEFAIIGWKNWLRHGAYGMSNAV